MFPPDRENPCPCSCFCPTIFFSSRLSHDLRLAARKAPSSSFVQGHGDQLPRLDLIGPRRERRAETAGAGRRAPSPTIIRFARYVETKRPWTSCRHVQVETLDAASPGRVAVAHLPPGGEAPAFEGRRADRGEGKRLGSPSGRTLGGKIEWNPADATAVRPSGGSSDGAAGEGLVVADGSGETISGGNVVRWDAGCRIGGVERAPTYGRGRRGVGPEVRGVGTVRMEARGDPPDGRGGGGFRRDGSIEGGKRTEGRLSPGQGGGRGRAGGPLWIVKPSDSSRGRGIYLLRELDELRYDQPSIVQRYISDPLTVGGYKADFRL